MAIFKKPFSYLILSGLTWAFVLACTAKAPVIPTTEPPQTIRPGVESDSARQHRLTAAEYLIEQGKQDLKKNRIEAAMRSFERAIQLHPDSFVSYFYMAEAWMQKADWPRARQFNRLAASYAEQDPDWQKRIRDQAQQLDRLD